MTLRREEVKRLGNEGASKWIVMNNTIVQMFESEVWEGSAAVRYVALERLSGMQRAEEFTADPNQRVELIPD